MDENQKPGQGIVEHLQDLVLESADVAELLQELVDYSAESLSVHNKLLCGVTLLRHKKPATMATSDPQVHAMDELQYAYGEGPCLTALRDLVTVHVPDLEDETRWADYCSTARSEGIGSVLSVPMPLEGDAGAALNLYAANTHAFSADDIENAEAHAAQASKSLRIAVRVAQLTEDRENLTAAMQSRTTINLAAGIIMAQNQCDQDTAMRILRSASNSRNLKLRSVASRVVASVAHDPTVVTHFD
ncbi:MAG TPA: GAF and ANTAR domain-containing protein [Arthrobacter sp.]